MKPINSKYIIIGLILIILALAYHAFFLTKSIKDLNNLQEYSTYELSNYVDANGKLNSKVSVLTLSNLQLLDKLHSSDSTVTRLALEIKKFKSLNSEVLAAMALDIKLLAKHRDSLLNIITRWDTTINGTDTTFYPVYTKKLDMFDKWITGNVTLGHSTFDIEIATISEYDIVMYRKRKNIFKPYEMFANCKVNNPYDRTANFTVIQKDKGVDRFNLSAAIGYGYAFGTGGLSPIVGITGGYTLLRW